jgi:hypothetical protein
VALLFAIRHRRGHDFWLPRAGQSLWGAFDLDVAANGPAPTSRFQATLGSCNYDPTVFQQSDGTTFRGYFQSYRYFDECRAELAGFLRFQPRYTAARAALLFALRRRHGTRPLVALHVRRGDFVHGGNAAKWGSLFADGYYDRAVDAIGDDAAYIVFSDDLAWCRDAFQFEHMEFAQFDAFTSLCLMTRCDVNVIANSSYSWWGAYLNPNADVYAPRTWWQAAEPPDDRQDDIVPPEWRTVPTFAAQPRARSRRSR